MKYKNSVRSLMGVFIALAIFFGAAAIPATQISVNGAIKISKDSVTLTTGKSKTVALKKGNKKITSGVTWKSKDPAVADVSNGKITANKAGKTVITVTYKKKTYKCSVTVEPEAESETVGGFSKKDNVIVEYGTTKKYVEFDLKTDEGGNLSDAERGELLDLGYTIDEEKGIAYKNQICETATYSFTALPSTLDEFKTFFAEAEPDDHGGFDVMAATICACQIFDGKPNPADPLGDKEPIRDVLEYLNGPSLDLSNVSKQQVITSMKSAVQSCGENVYKSYFIGATDSNDYTPTEPLTIKMYRGPYKISAKETITGWRPETYMIFVESAGSDTDKYMDVYYSERDKRWYSYEAQCLHIIANDFKTPKVKL